MLLIPFDRALDWRRPPLATFALILANILIFFLVQGGERAAVERAAEFYRDSGLAALELPAYRDYLEARRRLHWPTPVQENPLEAAGVLMFELQFDQEFQAALTEGRIISPAAHEHGRWQALRAQFLSHWQGITFIRYGLQPALLDPVSALSHMFMHGGLSHLFGNMLFLFAVGFLVEGALGRGAFLAAYLASGIGAAGLFVAMNATSLVPLVGASGAIAGLMGLYAVLFGKRRISFFYYVGVYFDYVKAPAFLLLVLWLGWEVVQFLTLGKDSNVAYLAHIGGLATGAVIAAVLLRLPGRVDRDYLEANARTEAFRAQCAAADGHLQRLELERALALLEPLWAQSPNDRELLRKLFISAKSQPQSEAFHRAAHAIFLLPERDAASNRWVHQTYREYVKRARPRFRLFAEHVSRLAERFTQSGDFEDAERLIAVMLKSPERFPQAPAALATLAAALIKQGEPRRGRECFELLRSRFPHSGEAVLAEQVLGQGPPASR
jgi:membrane associated rhomboid family serine protease